MGWLKFLTAIAVLAIAVSILGALLRLAGIVTQADSLVVFVLVAAVVVVVAVLGTRRRRFLSNPYW